MTQELAPELSVKQEGWPSFWDADKLRHQMGLLRKRAFDSGFRQKPFTSEELMFPSFLQGAVYEYGLDWRAISDPNHEKYDPESFYYVDPIWPRYIGCDIAGKKRRGTVIFVIAVSPQGVRHILDIQMMKASGPEFVRRLQATDDNRLLSARVIFVENNALQEQIVDWIKEVDAPCWNKVRGFRMGNNKMDPEIGLPAIEVQYNTRRWRLAIPHLKHIPKEPDPKNGTLCICGLCMLVSAASTFTADDLDQTPDTIAAQFIAKEASRQGERFSETSIDVVKVTSKDIRRAIKLGPSKQEQANYRIPVSTQGLGFNIGPPRNYYRPTGKRDPNRDEFGRLLTLKMPEDPDQVEVQIVVEES